MLAARTVGLLQQVMGMSDIMRGDVSNQYEGVGQSAMKAKFGSVRVQALQDQFAVFASNLMQLKAEVIARHFSPETIAKQSNMINSPDAHLLQQALALIKNPDEARLRVDIRPESVAMVDHALLKEERTSYMNALSTFMQSSAPLMDADPTVKPFLLELLQWGLSGFKGSQEIEGVLDRAIESSKQAAQEPEQPDPAVAAQQAQMQHAIALEQLKAKIAIETINTKTQADMAIRQQDLEADIQTAQATGMAKSVEISSALEATLAEIEAKTKADIILEQVQTQANIAQTQASAESEVQKDAINSDLEIEKAMAQTSLKIAEINAAAKAKIKEAQAKPKKETK